MGQGVVISSETPDLTPVLSTAGWVLYWTDPIERSDIRKAEWQCAGDLPEGYVPKVWWGGRGGDPSPPPYSQAPGPGPRALHQHSGSQGNSQKPPPYLRHGQHHPCPTRHQRWGLSRLLPRVGLRRTWQVVRSMISPLKLLGHVFLTSEFYREIMVQIPASVCWLCQGWGSTLWFNVWLYFVRNNLKSHTG